MKKYFTLIFLLPLFCFAQKNTYTISGSLVGLKDKTGVYVTDANNPTDTLSRALVKDGKFILTGSVPEPGLYHLAFAEQNKKALVFLDNNKISVSGNLEDIKKVKVEGSPSHNDFQEFEARFNPLFNKLNQVTETIKTTGLTDSLKAEGEKIAAQIQEEISSFTKNRPASYVSPFLLVITSQLSDDMTLLENRFNALTPAVQESFFGKMLKESITNNKFGAVGSDAIEFTQNDIEGKPVSLSSFKGKYVLIDFWASWCRPCREENPNVVANYEAYKSKNFTVLGVSLDRSKDPWLKAIKDDKLAWTHVSDLKFWDNAVAKKYNIQSIPQNFLVGPDGKIIARNLRGPELSQRLAELLK